MADQLKQAIAAQQEQLLACVHCGMCLPHCPTYGVRGDENDSPRGRLYLMRAVAEERIEPNAAYVSHLESCIVCRACETACPSGVEYAHLMGVARAEMRANRLDDLGIVGRAVRWLGLNTVISHRAILKPVVWPLRIIRRVRPRGGWPRWLPKFIRTGLEMLPVPVPRRPAPSAVLSAGTRRVLQFRGCIMDELYHDVNQATTRVLKVNGCNVEMPSEQASCGALHEHAGYIESARMLARRNVDAFDDGTDDPIVINAAGCGALLKEYGRLLADDPEYADRAKRFSARVQDATELLTRHEITVGAPIQGRTTYDAPCHLHHAQRIQGGPVDVLRAAIPALDLVPLRGAERCCGSGGIYSLTHAEISGDVLDEKIDAVRETNARILVTTNPGCQMQIQSGARSAGLDLRVAHIMELLDESYANAGRYESDG